MHGLIFVTWEKYLAERFGTRLLHTYRSSIGETAASAPIANRLYDDATLLAGVGAASKLTHVDADTLLREYGRYFIVNGLTSHLCAYILQQVNDGRDLLLKMRSSHAQISRTAEMVTPPIFEYEVFSTNADALILSYDSPRKLCSVLYGAIEGAAERFNEQVHINERTCMKKGAAACRFELQFSHARGQTTSAIPREQQALNLQRQQFSNLILSTLPEQGGVTLQELLQMLQLSSGLFDAHLLRPSKVVEALNHLQYAGFVSSTAMQAGDTFTNRRYWRTPLADER